MKRGVYEKKQFFNYFLNNKLKRVLPLETNYILCNYMLIISRIQLATTLGSLVYTLKFLES